MKRILAIVLFWALFGLGIYVLSFRNVGLHYPVNNPFHSTLDVMIALVVLVCVVVPMLALSKYLRQSKK